MKTKGIHYIYPLKVVKDLEVVVGFEWEGNRQGPTGSQSVRRERIARVESEPEREPMYGKDA